MVNNYGAYNIVVGEQVSNLEQGTQVVQKQIIDLKDDYNNKEKDHSGKSTSAQAFIKTGVGTMVIQQKLYTKITVAQS